MKTRKIFKIKNRQK